MDVRADPEQPDLALLLPRSTYRLPAPLADSPENLARRDNAGIAHIIAMLPANADKADLATQCVAAHASAQTCRAGDPTSFLKCHARANITPRRAHTAWRRLQRAQAEA